MSEKIEIIAELKDLVTSKMNDINASVERMEASLGRAGKADSGGIGGGIMKGVFSANLLTGALSKAGSAALDFEKDAIQSFSNFEQFQTALTTMFHGNREEAKMLSAQLQQFAKETPFELTEIQAATKQMLAFGSTSGGVVEEMRRLGDVSSGIGAPLGDIAYLYGTIRTSGRAMTMDINQFANRGIPIWKELEKITGKNGQALRKYVEEGKVGFPQIEQVFKNMTQEGGQFFNLMEAQSKTLGGQISNLGDAWDQLKVGVGEMQSGILKSTTAWVTDMVSELNEIVQNANKLEGNLKAVGLRSPGWFMSHFDDQFDKQRQEQYRQTDREKYGLDLLKNNETEKFNSLIKNLNSQIQTDKQLIDYYAGIPDKYKNGKGTTEDIKGWLADMSMKSQTVRTLMSAFESNNKNKTGGANGKGGIDDSSKLDALAKANRPTQMYITIEELVHELNIKTETLKEGTAEASSIVSKALISAVNDLSVMNNNR